VEGNVKLYSTPFLCASFVGVDNVRRNVVCSLTADSDAFGASEWKCAFAALCKNELCPINGASARARDEIKVVVLSKTARA